MLAPRRLYSLAGEAISVGEAARRSGLSVEEVHSRIAAGAIPVTSVEVDGQPEVRILLEDMDGLGGNPRHPRSQRRKGGTKTPPASDAADSVGPAPESSAAVVNQPETGSALSITPEIRALASGLADELFQRWELAMQKRFEEELKLRLKSELEHREHQAAVLQEEVDQRARGAYGPGGTKVVGMADLYATWERDRKLINQSREVAEMERQMAEMRERLRELGADLDESTVTVDPNNQEPKSQVPPEDGSSK